MHTWVIIKIIIGKIVKVYNQPCDRSEIETGCKCFRKSILAFGTVHLSEISITVKLMKQKHAILWNHFTSDDIAKDFL